MFERKTSDLHMHLNGSFSLNFLRRIAEKNNKTAEFQKLMETRETYAKMVEEESQRGVHDKSITLIWAQFSFIHKIVQTLEDIQEGTVDVMQSSKAAYLEIRTTPKDMAGSAWEKYVDAFVAGLIDGNKKCAGRKIARGLLSLDRTIHNEEISYAIIDHVVAEKERTGLLVGIDLSGNPLAERKLTGEALASVIRYALVKKIGVGIHLGEVDTPIESSEVDNILAVLAAWHNQDIASHRFQGRVRLGHGIYLSDSQRSIIRELKIPIEICPSCHTKLNWWSKPNPHPVTQIYKFWHDPVVVGTDDEIIFGGNAKQENHTLLELLGYPTEQKKNHAHEHQSKFRFTN